MQEREFSHARRMLKESGIEKPFVVVHPGSKGSADCWPVDRFIELYKRLEEAGISVVVSGSEVEGQICDNIAREKAVSLRKITGQTDLRTLAAVLSLSEVVVANSTGPLHLLIISSLHWLFLLRPAWLVRTHATRDQIF